MSDDVRARCDFSFVTTAKRSYYICNEKTAFKPLSFKSSFKENHSGNKKAAAPRETTMPFSKITFVISCRVSSYFIVFSYSNPLFHVGNFSLQTSITCSFIWSLRAAKSTLLLWQCTTSSLSAFEPTFMWCWLWVPSVMRSEAEWECFLRSSTAVPSTGSR